MLVMKCASPALQISMYFLLTLKYVCSKCLSLLLKCGDISNTTFLFNEKNVSTKGNVSKEMSAKKVTKV